MKLTQRSLKVQDDLTTGIPTHWEALRAVQDLKVQHSPQYDQTGTEEFSEQGPWRGISLQPRNDVIDFSHLSVRWDSKQAEAILSRIYLHISS